MSMLYVDLPRASKWENIIEAGKKQEKTKVIQEEQVYRIKINGNVVYGPLTLQETWDKLDNHIMSPGDKLRIQYFWTKSGLWSFPMRISEFALTHPPKSVSINHASTY